MDTTTSTPIFQTKEEQIHDLLVAFFNHNMASNKKEGEDDKSERRLTQTQEDMYATEWTDEIAVAAENWSAKYFHPHNSKLYPSTITAIINISTKLPTISFICNPLLLQEISFICKTPVRKAEISEQYLKQQKNVSKIN